MVIAVDVLVVGAGPTGLLAAAELHRRGVNCLLIDAHDSPMVWDRATVVHPRSLEIFESLGIVKPLLTAGVKQKRACIHAGGKLLGEIDLSLCGSRYPFNIGISEEFTEAVLTDYLTRQGGSVTRATKLVVLQERKDDVLATVETHGIPTELCAKWVIGCDGYHGTVRTLAGIELDGHDIAVPWAVFDAGVSDWPSSFEANYGYLDELPVILTSLPDKRWRVYLRPSSTDSDLVADALSTLRTYLPAAKFVDVTNPTRFQCHTTVARKFRSGRILLAGDAAHACSPAQGHGMNTGLHDAFNLAWKLALVCQGRCSEKLLDSYEAERRPVAQLVTASGDTVEAAQMVKGADQRRERDAAIRSTFADPDTRHHEAVAEAELDIDYAASPIVLGDRHDACWPGQRLPDWIEIRQADASSLLHHHINRAGHTAFLIGGPSTHRKDLAEMAREIEALADGALIERTLSLTSNANASDGDGLLDPQTSERLGIADTVLLVVRADGHIGLRAERDHASALSAYVDRLRS